MAALSLSLSLSLSFFASLLAMPHTAQQCFECALSRGPPASSGVGFVTCLVAVPRSAGGLGRQQVDGRAGDFMTQRTRAAAAAAIAP